MHHCHLYKIVCFFCLFIKLAIFANTNQATTVVTARVVATPLLEVGSSTVVLNLNLNVQDQIGFMGSAIPLRVRCAHQNGFYVKASALPQFAHGSNWKLIHTKHEQHYLEFCLFSDHDRVGNLTPIESQGPIKGPVGGTQHGNQAKVIDRTCADQRQCDYLLYPFILPIQANLSPAGIYRGTVVFVLEEY